MEEDKLGATEHEGIADHSFAGKGRTHQFRQVHQAICRMANLMNCSIFVPYGQTRETTFQLGTAAMSAVVEISLIVNV